MNFEGSFTWALCIATLCMILLIRAVFDWDFVIDLLCSKIRRSKKLKKMMEERETILAGQGLSKEKRQAFEDLLIPLTKGDKNLLPTRMDKIFRKETVHRRKTTVRQNVGRIQSRRWPRRNGTTVSEDRR